ncbi:hypothetical protein [Flavobacterium restrictum]|uniref:Lipocalin-like domain-containing protein n=1 Tax=Flavobacterium restrictum TaxID=2594428 RepID=A0A553ED65_9FLAO|nr:hypothetical protein [Flavobacterium restrictum]TRX42984.1 hypothetical protein FNW21_01220 [Flavobacterium restrictum]
MKTKLSFLTLTLFLLFSCATTKSVDDEQLKKKLTGSWSGSEKDNQKPGLTKYWIQNRNKNGTYVLLFTVIENCEVENHVEKGKWGVKDGLFYETFDEDGKTDVYEIEIIDTKVKFKAKQLSLEFGNTEYEFIETREE